MNGTVVAESFVDEGRRSMSVVLYAIGLVLMLWGGYVLLSGDMIATLDIAASLVGSGAFAIGLGAVAAAIKRLARTIVEQGVLHGATSSERDAYDVPRRGQDLPPLQELRRTAPQPVAEPASEPPASRTPTAPAEAAFAAALERDLETAPSPPRRPRIEVAPARPSAPAPAVPSAAALSKSERRSQAREDARAEAETEPSLPVPAPSVIMPPVVAPILGGGFAAGRTESDPAPAPEPIEAPEPDVAPETEPPAEAEAEAVAEPAEAVIEPELAPAMKSEAPVVPPPADKRLPEPKVPDWLARARARREARAAAGDAEEPVAAAAALAPPPAPAPVEPSPEPAPADEPSDEPSADEAPERTVLREGEHNGVLYRFYADGSVEAESEHGMRRFDSLEELRATVLAVRGHIEGEDDDDPDARPEAEMMVAPAIDAPSDPAIEDSAVAVEPPLNPAAADDDFEAALAALESGLSDDRPQNPAAPSLDEVRPGRDR